MTRPNLFDFGTSELTQDTVLCWLIAWADNRNADLDPTLHTAGSSLVAVILGKWGHSLPDGKLTTSVQRQVERVDVVARVGADFLIGIEDKTNSGPHNDLARYKKTLDAIGAKEGRKVLPVYVKTGERKEDAFVRGKGREVLGRGELLTIVGQALRRGPQNAILADFGDHLARQEADATAWTRVPTTEGWPWNGWKGFYGRSKSRCRGLAGSVGTTSPTPRADSGRCGGASTRWTGAPSTSSCSTPRWPSGSRLRLPSGGISLFATGATASGAAHLRGWCLLAHSASGPASTSSPWPTGAAGG